MVVYDALWITRGAGRIIQRDGIPFVLRHRPVEIRVPGGQQGLVFAGLGRDCGIVIHDQLRRLVQVGTSLARQRLQFRIHQQDLGLTMAQDEPERGRIQAGVQRVENGAGHRHAVMRLDHRGGVEKQSGNGIAPLNAHRDQSGGKTARARQQIAIVDALVAMDDRDVIGKHPRRPVQQGQGRQRLVVRLLARQILVVICVRGHDAPHSQ